MNKFLNGIYSTVGDLKKAFRDLLMVMHPDKGGSNEECAKLISEYESLITRMPNKKAIEREEHKDSSQRVYTASDFMKFDKDFVDALMGLIGLKMEGIGIEVCGWFLYVSGVKKENKDSVKALGYKWNSTKQTWVFFPSWWSAGKNHKPWNMAEIRQTYGSQQIENVGANQIHA